MESRSAPVVAPAVAVALALAAANGLTPRRLGVGLGRLQRQMEEQAMGCSQEGTRGGRRGRGRRSRRRRTR